MVPVLMPCAGCKWPGDDDDAYARKAVTLARFGRDVVVSSGMRFEVPAGALTDGAAMPLSLETHYRRAAEEIVMRIEAEALRFCAEHQCGPGDIVVEHYMMGAGFAACDYKIRKKRSDEYAPSPCMGGGL